VFHRFAPRARAVRPAAVALAAVALAAGCTSPGRPAQPAVSAGGSGPATTLRVLAGSELADMGPILEAAREATGVHVTLDYTGTLDGAQDVLDGRTTGRYDAIWFSSNRYLALYPQAQSKLSTSAPIMASPVILGLRRSVAHRLGWDASPPTWSDLAAAAGAKKFTYGMTNPAASNSGFSALVGVAAALAGAGAALSQKAVASVAPRLRGFFSGQTLTAGSSGWLSDGYARRAGASSPAGEQVDGLINYESVLLSLNASHKLREPLTLIYPRDGVVTADYPLTLLSSAAPGKSDAYRRLTAYLRRPGVQQQIAATTHRRPMTPGVALPPTFTRAQLPPELPFPNQLGVVNALIGAYFDKIRPPSRTIYVLDTSGSMHGARLKGLKAALTDLTGTDGSLTGQFARFHNREQVTLLPFNTTPGQPVAFTVPATAPAPVLGRIRAVAGGLRAGGDTSIYDSVEKAYGLAGAGPLTGYFTSIVLMTDGENNQGAGIDGFAAWYSRLPGRLHAVPVFPILFGENNTAEMNKLASVTGGRTFDARTRSLAAAFREIRGYQ
jgi:Ca-activated chloride channel family protein